MNKPATMNKLLQYSFLVLGLLVGALAGSSYQMKVMQQEALDKDFAHYNTKTGVWEWGQVVSGISLNDTIPDDVYKAANQAKPVKKVTK